MNHAETKDTVLLRLDDGEPMKVSLVPDDNGGTLYITTPRRTIAAISNVDKIGFDLPIDVPLHKLLKPRGSGKVVS